MAVKGSTKFFFGDVKMKPELEQLFIDAGFFQYGETTTDKIHFSQEVRTLCENNVCRKYGTTWACPPAVGTVEGCKAKCLTYRNVVVFNKKYDLEDSFDFDGMQAGHKDFNEAGRKLARDVKNVLADFFLLSNEGCVGCKECTYPEAPCRFPGDLHPSVEGFGIYVNELTRSAGINYINGANTVTYIGALLYNE